MDLTAEQIQFLTYTVLGEARGEGPEGMLGVANVIANRVDSGIYPDNPVDVAAQPYQFSTNNRGAGGNQTATRREVPVGSDLYNQAEEIVRGAIIERSLPDITGRAIMYHARSITPYWAASSTTRWGTTRVGNHVYYARQPVPPGSIPDVATLLAVRRAPPVPLTRSTTVVAKQAQASATARINDALNAVDDSRRKAAVAFFPWAKANEGDRGAGAMSMTSRLGSRPDFADSVSAPILVDYPRARADFALAGLLDRRISLTAPNPPAPRSSDGLVERGNIDLASRPLVRNADGTISTVRTISVNIDGAEVLLPTVTDSGKIISDAAAIREYERTGKHLGKFSDPVSATRYAQDLHRQEEIRVISATSKATATGKAGARRDLAVSVSIRPGAEKLKAGDTRTADSGLITYVRKTYPVDGYGRPIVDAPVVVKPAAKPSPTWRVQEAITRAQAGVRASSMAPTAAAAAAWKATPAPARSAPVKGTTGRTGNSVMPTLPMRAAAAKVSERESKTQPKGSTTQKIYTVQLPKGSVPAVNPKAKDSPNRVVYTPSPAAEMIRSYTTTPLPAKSGAKPAPGPVAPTPLPRLRRFGEGTIPPSVKGDPVDFKKLADGIDAERRRLSGEPPLPRVRPVTSPAVPARRPDSKQAVTPTPGKVKLSGLPDQKAPPLPRPRPVSTATVKPIGPSALPKRRPDSKPATFAALRRPAIEIEVVGGARRRASPRLVQPVGQYQSNGVANPAYRDYTPTYQSDGGGLMPSGAYSGSFTDALGGVYYDRHL